ncbi:MAG: YtxH domain-containing protein [Paludibacteraceae bacterium]|nr:YtxH domain-containing protein [Paludibacteraceae bacterium]
MGNNFVKGAVFGAAAAMLCNYLFNTEEGKETCRKVKAKVKETMDDIKSTVENGMKEMNKEDHSEDNQAVVPVDHETDGAE